ncbi:UNKNOWN [Stylonychia lemnae]|uniref:Uncharacterized protein n=1 Tax=Stylonychia lemnae TaxID=5949 RepID=A0A077ZYQ8_STYLE|nr:UNKNOWN [Stylonychia lemnae]|eukprot:CDW73668.1 UNKNOWN [Stylonychia lemnae]
MDTLIKKGKTLIILLQIVLALPECFGLYQLPIEILDNSSTTSSFTTIEYEPTLDYFAVGGYYGQTPIIGLYNNKNYFNRFVWLNIYDYDNIMTQINILIKSVQSETQANIDIVSCLLLRLDLQGQVNKTTIIQNIGMLKRSMINTLAIRPSNGDIYLLLSNLNQQGMVYVISNDLTQINQIHNINIKQGFYCSVKFDQTNDMAKVMGVLMPDDKLRYGLFYSVFQDNLASSYTQSGIYTNQLVQYQPIIPIIEQNLDYLAGCLEGTVSEMAIFGMFYIKTSTGALQILYRDVTSTYQQSGAFYCIGIRFASSSDITLFYQAKIGNNALIVFTTIKSYPLSGSQTSFFEFSECQSTPKSDFIRVNLIKTLYMKNGYIHLGFLIDKIGRQRAYLNYYLATEYLSLLSDSCILHPEGYTIIAQQYFDLSTSTYDKVQNDMNEFLRVITITNMLPYVSLWQDQINLTKNDKLVSQLLVKQERNPARLSSAIDCLIGMQCQIYQSNFTLSGQCSDAGTNRNYIT